MVRKPKQRPDGRYEATATLDGIRHHFYGKTPKELAANIERAKQRSQQRIAARGGRETVAAFLARWLTIRKPYLAPHTYENYARVTRLHINPAFGHVRLDRLGGEQIQELISDMLARGYAPGTVTLVRATITIALNYAVRHREIPANEAKLTDPPRIPEADYHPLNPDEAKRFLAAVKDDRLAALYTVALAVGLRISEALGLRWQDVNLATGVAHVRVQLQREGERWTLPPLKGRRSRVLILPAFARAALARHHLQQEKERAAIKRWGNEWDLIFAKPDGRPLYAQMIRVYMLRLLKDAGLAARTPHDLRHSAASLLVLQGASITEVSALLGHASTRVTDMVYVHLFDKQRTRVANLMDDLFSDEVSSKTSSAENDSPTDKGKVDE